MCEYDYQSEIEDYDDEDLTNIINEIDSENPLCNNVEEWDHCSDNCYNQINTTYNLFEGYEKPYLNDEYLYCEKPQEHIIECNSIEPRKRIQIKMKFTDGHGNIPGYMIFETRNLISGLSYIEKYNKTDDLNDVKDNKKRGSKDQGAGNTNINKRTKRIINHVRLMFQHPSLKTKINFEKIKHIANKRPIGYKSDWYWSEDWNLAPTRQGIYDFKRSLHEQADFFFNEFPTIGTAHILLTAQSRRYGDNNGIAVKDSICDLHTFNAVAIVRWHNSTLDTAQTLAHEIGHLLGMSHDFARVSMHCLVYKITVKMTEKDLLATTKSIFFF